MGGKIKLFNERNGKVFFYLLHFTIVRNAIIKIYDVNSKYADYGMSTFRVTFDNAMHRQRCSI